MGRETRQARRARERREQELRRNDAVKTRKNWIVAASAAVIVLAVVFFGGLALANRTDNKTAAALVPTPKEAPGKVIDGVVGCNPGMEYGTVYHVHMHLAMYVAGKPVTLPALIGFNNNHDCLYWLHTHDTTGIIHLEAPHHLLPTLGNFFDVWGQPLSTSQLATNSVKSGQNMKVFVDMKPYNGNPRDITLTAHTTITIEIGPPFVKPQPYNFGQL